MISFDNSIDALLALVEALADFGKLERLMMVRDLKGQLRLAAACPEGTDLSALNEALKSGLGNWFPEPILQRTRGNTHLFNAVMDPSQAQSTSLNGHRYEPSLGQEPRTVTQDKWWLTERRISKQSWFRRADSTLWNLGAGPTVVSFFSFKGGVGRTTVAVGAAVNLAAEGSRVLLVDLDLEAPGLGALLIGDESPGTIDALADYVATGQCSPTTNVFPARKLGEPLASNIDVLGAGQLDSNYFEKLARLDFVGTGVFGNEQSPTERALVAIVKAVSFANARPDFVFLDARAGLHDIAGLSLQGLAHIDVIVARDSEQNYQGLDLVIERIGTRDPDSLRCAIVQTMAPADSSSKEFELSTTDFRNRVWESFSQKIYNDDDTPAIDDPTAAHYPSIIPFSERLLRFTSVEAMIDELKTGPYKNLTKRLRELATLEGA